MHKVPQDTAMQLDYKSHQVYITARSSDNIEQTTQIPNASVHEYYKKCKLDQHKAKYNLTATYLKTIQYVKHARSNSYMKHQKS